MPSAWARSGMKVDQGRTWKDATSGITLLTSLTTAVSSLKRYPKTCIAEKKPEKVTGERRGVHEACSSESTFCAKRALGRRVIMGTYVCRGEHHDHDDKAGDDAEQCGRVACALCTVRGPSTDEVPNARGRRDAWIQAEIIRVERRTSAPERAVRPLSRTNSTAGVNQITHQCQKESY